MTTIHNHEDLVKFLGDYYQNTFLNNMYASARVSLAIDASGVVYDVYEKHELKKSIYVWEVVGDVALSVLQDDKTPAKDAFIHFILERFKDALDCWWDTTRDIMYEDEKDEYINRLRFYETILNADRHAA